MERKKTVVTVVVLLLLWSMAPIGWAQRGVGDASGVVRQGLQPDTVSIRGEVVKVITGPCEMGTGRYEIGSHFVIQTEDGKEKNIHLGPAQLVQGVTSQLPQGETVTVCAFRTEKMPEGHYNAVTVSVGENMLRLRDQTLRPVWAGQIPANAYRTGRNGPVYRQNNVNPTVQVESYQNTWAGPGYGWGNGPRRMGWGQGRGRGYGRGWGYRGGGRSRYGMRRGGRW